MEKRLALQQQGARAYCPGVIQPVYNRYDQLSTRITKLKTRNAQTETQFLLLFCGQINRFKNVYNYSKERVFFSPQTLLF